MKNINGFRDIDESLTKPLFSYLYFNYVKFHLNPFSRFRLADLFPKIMRYKPLCAAGDRRPKFSKILAKPAAAKNYSLWKATKTYYCGHKVR